MSSSLTEDLRKSDSQAFVGDGFALSVLCQLIWTKMESPYDVLHHFLSLLVPLFCALPGVLRLFLHLFLHLLGVQYLVDDDLSARQWEITSIDVSVEDIAVMHLIVVDHLRVVVLVVFHSLSYVMYFSLSVSICEGKVQTSLFYFGKFAVFDYSLIHVGALDVVVVHHLCQAFVAQLSRNFMHLFLPINGE